MEKLSHTYAPIWVLSSLIGLLCWIAVAMPLSAESLSSQDYERLPLFITITPKLTSPAEIPIAEVQSEPVYTLSWLAKTVAVPMEADSLNPDSGPANDWESTLEQWLVSVKLLLENR